MIEYKKDFFVISGELNFTTAVKLWNESLALMAKASQLNFDFSAVPSSNSAGIALLLEWVKYAKLHQKSIRFNNIPKQLRSIITVSGIEKILGLAV
jgi:phospholipid transport system transporter-binding protein